MKTILLLASAVLGLLLAASAYPKQQTVPVSRDVVQNVDTVTYTGKIVAIDLVKYSLTINGHDVIESHHYKVETREPINKSHKSTTPKKQAAPQADAKRVFKIEAMCKVSTASKPIATLTDLHVGDAVNVQYNIVTGLDKKPTFTVIEIEPAPVK